MTETPKTLRKSLDGRLPRSSDWEWLYQIHDDHAAAWEKDEASGEAWRKEGERLGQELGAAILHNMEAQARIVELQRDAARYQVLRGPDDDPTDTHAYRPEELCIWGGKELDEYCDRQIAARGGEQSGIGCGLTELPGGEQK